MPFPVRLLSVDEEVAVETRPHWTYLAGQLGVLVALGAAAIVVVAVDFPLPAVAVAAALAGVAAVALGIRLLGWANTYYLVTDRRIVYWKGVPRWRGVELSLDLVDEIDVRQTMRERMLSVGTLAVHSVVDGHVRNLGFVPRPVDVRREVYRLLREAEVRRLEAAGGPQVAGSFDEAEPGDWLGAPAAELDIPDQIRKLYGLVESGILTEAEFEEKKRDLLGRL